MAFPHPKARKDKYRKEDKSNSGGVFGNFFERTINVTEDRNAEDEVNGAKNGTFDALAHVFDSLVIGSCRGRLVQNQRSRYYFS